MSRPSTRTLFVALGGGTAHLAAVELAFRALGHAPPERCPLSDPDRVVGLFALGFLASLAVAHTRLYSPAIGLPAAFAWATVRDAAAPAPEWSEVGGFLVVDRTVFLSAYADGWVVLVGLLAVAAGAEFGLRTRYEFGDEGLRNLPSAPTRLRNAALDGLAVGGVFGLAATVRIATFGVSPTSAVPVMAATTTAAAAVPVAAAARGLVAPTACFALIVPSLARTVFTGSEGGPVFLLLLGPIAVALVLVAVVEAAVRRRFDRRPAD
ncbi:hypothetical protein [Halorubrum halophilum]|uniref:hypothetical protein n=1 Tax=Halorubrum halophilum TaxID=413816 RepID=UPI00067918AC|nr:hypothetical protein [Halorubrum halophilum]